MIVRKRVPTHYFLPCASLAVLGGIVFLWLGSLDHPWFAFLALAIAFILIIKLFFNQYIEIDVFKGTISHPVLYLFRRTEKAEGISIDAEHTVDSNGNSHYMMTVSGDFGTIDSPLPDYESYATAIYQKLAANLL